MTTDHEQVVKRLAVIDAVRATLKRAWVKPVSTFHVPGQLPPTEVQMWDTLNYLKLVKQLIRVAEV